MKLAFLGSGPISEFHVPALREAGFEIETAFSRPGSERLRSFCQRHEIDQSDNWDEFLEIASRCSAIFVAVKTEATLEVLRKVAPLGLPIMAEKPGAADRSSLEALKELDLNQFCWAYNRRFYQSIQFIRNHKERIRSAAVSWPETAKLDHQFIINGCHIVDTLRFIHGDLQIVERISLGRDQGFVALLQNSDGVPVALNATFGAFANAEASFFLDDSRVLSLKPLEEVKEHSQMLVVEPNSKSKLRRYVPEIGVTIEETVTRLKPGFLNQSQAFMRLVQNHEYGDLSAFHDGLESLALTLELVEDR